LALVDSAPIGWFYSPTIFQSLPISTVQSFLRYTNKPSSSHPIHPATVHFPLAFLTLANILSLLYGSVLYLPSNPFFTRDEQNLGALSILGYAANLLGIVTSIPAILTGAAELYAMIQGNGLYQTDEKGQKKLVPKVKIALMHVRITCFLIDKRIDNM
jgi:hypothetical protein